MLQVAKNVKINGSQLYIMVKTQSNVMPFVLYIAYTKVSSLN